MGAWNGLTDKPPPLPEFVPRCPEDDREALQHGTQLVGHQVVEEGKWARCTVCNARRLKTNFDFWTMSACPGANAGVDLKEATKGLKRSREDDIVQGPRKPCRAPENQNGGCR